MFAQATGLYATCYTSRVTTTKDYVNTTTTDKTVNSHLHTTTRAIDSDATSTISDDSA
jgi:hypothetical protein